MKNKTTKSAALFLFALLACTAVSCGGETSPADIDTDTVSASVTETGTVTEAPAYTAPAVDYGETPFTFYIHRYKGAYKLCAYDGISAKEDDGDIINDALLKRNQAVEDALNVKIQAYENDQGIGPLTSSILAGDHAYDAAITYQQLLRNLFGSEGYLYNLYDIDTLTLDAPWVNQDANREMTVNGKQYAMLNDACMYSMVSGGCLFFSKSLISANDLEDPYDLVYSGKWTIDNFCGLAKQVSSDLNGDSVWDENDSYGMNGSPTVMMMCVKSSGIRMAEKNTDDVFTLTLNNEKTISVVDKLTALLGNTQINMQPDAFKKSPLDDVWYDIVLPMFKNNQLLFTFNWVFYALELRDMDTDFGILPMPKYDEAQESYHSYLSDSFADFLMVPSSVNDASMAGNVLNAMGYYSNRYLYPEVVERTVTDKTMRDDAAADMLDIIFHNVLFDLADIYGWDNGLVYNIWSNCVTKNTNVFASEYAKLEPKIQANMEKTLDYLLKD